MLFCKTPWLYTLLKVTRHGTHCTVLSAMATSPGITELILSIMQFSGVNSFTHRTTYIMSLKSPAQVKDIAAALEAMTEDVFRNRYNQIPAKEYGADLDEEDFSYTWEWFKNVRELYHRAAAEGRHVLFTADQ